MWLDPGAGPRAPKKASARPCAVVPSPREQFVRDHGLTLKLLDRAMASTAREACERVSAAILFESGRSPREVVEGGDSRRFAATALGLVADGTAYRSTARLNHCWVVWQGRHYDAERPEGTCCCAELPVFLRWLERAATPAERLQRHDEIVRAATEL